MAEFDRSTGILYEKGYVLSSNQTGGYDYNFVSGLALNSGGTSISVGEINFTVNDPIDGFMHSHTPQTLSCFSLSDIKAVFDLYDKDKMAYWQSFTAAVVTNDGTAYMLKIEDSSVFESFGSGYLSNNNGFIGLEEAFTLYNDTYLNIGYSKEDANELSLLKCLNNSGLKLLKDVNGNFSTWQGRGVSSNGNNVIDKDCDD